MSKPDPQTTNGRAAAMFKSLRIKQEMSQQAISTLMNMPRSAFTNLENGKRKITLDDVVDLCQIYAVDPIEAARHIWKKQ